MQLIIEPREKGAKNIEIADDRLYVSLTIRQSEIPALIAALRSEDDDQVILNWER